MVREIKFRAWDKDIKQMFHNVQATKFDVFLNDGAYEVMQFTGLKDKNAKEIYEGDLVKVGDEIMEVFWYTQSSAFWLLHLNPQDKGYYRASSGVPARDWNWLDEGEAVNWHNNPKVAPVEVIGNIYENPELLKA